MGAHDKGALMILRSNRWLAALALAGLAGASQAAPDAARGQQFFNATHGREWSCASCHGERPVADGRHAATGKTIAPLAPAASASGGERGARVPLLPAYQNECGACHVAYPPGMLPAASWRRLTSDLPHHFGTDASLDAPTLTQLSGWLDANAGRGKRVDKAPPPEDRIT